MVPMGGSSKNVLITQKPKFIPVKLYFNKIPGICCKQREIIHDELESGKNNQIEFIVVASKAALDELVNED